MNGRSFISISMFGFIVILALSGLIMEVGEAIAEAAYEDASNVPSGLLFSMSFTTGVHVLSGICFAVLSVFHIMKNWSALKNHLKTKSGKLSKEFLFACLLILTVLLFTLLAELLIE